MERTQRLLNPADGTSLRKGKSCSAASGSRDMRNIVRCWGSVSATSWVKASMTAWKRAAGSSEASGGSSEDAWISG
jgi:hypothetical protein